MAKIQQYNIEFAVRGSKRDLLPAPKDPIDRRLGTSTKEITTLAI